MSKKPTWSLHVSGSGTEYHNFKDGRDELPRGYPTPSLKRAPLSENELRRKKDERAIMNSYRTGIIVPSVRFVKPALLSMSDTPTSCKK